MATFVLLDCQQYQDQERAGNWSPMPPFCAITHRSFSLRDETKMALMESNRLAMLLHCICYEYKMYHYSFRATHSHLGYHLYHKIFVHFVKFINT